MTFSVIVFTLPEGRIRQSTLYKLHAACDNILTSLKELKFRYCYWRVCKYFKQLHILSTETDLKTIFVVQLLTFLKLLLQSKACMVAKCVSSMSEGRRICRHGVYMTHT